MLSLRYCRGVCIFRQRIFPQCDDSAGHSHLAPVDKFELYAARTVYRRIPWVVLPGMPCTVPCRTMHLYTVRDALIGFACAPQMGLLPVLIYPICIFETIDKLGPFSLLGVAAVIYTAVVVCYHGLVDPFRDGLEHADQSLVEEESPQAFNINLGSLQAVNIICL